MTYGSLLGAPRQSHFFNHRKYGLNTNKLIKLAVICTQNAHINCANLPKMGVLPNIVTFRNSVGSISIVVQLN